MAWSGVGTIMGNRNGTADAVILDEFQQIKNLGITKIRMQPSVEVDSWVSWTKIAAGLAQQVGLEILFGGSSSVTLTSDNWDTYADAIVDLAGWAAANNITNFSIGNELELLNGSGITDSQLIDRLLLLATAVKALNPSLIVHYQVSNGAETQWVDLGDINRLGLNIYGDDGSFSTFESRATDFQTAHPVAGYISEFNIHFTWASVTTDEEKQMVEISRRYRVLRDLGFDRIYQFCWRYSNSSDDFSILRLDSSYRLFTNVIATDNGRPYFIRT